MNRPQLIATFMREAEGAEVASAKLLAYDDPTIFAAAKFYEGMAVAFRAALRYIDAPDAAAKKLDG